MTWDTVPEWDDDYWEGEPPDDWFDQFEEGDWDAMLAAWHEGIDGPDEGE